MIDPRELGRSAPQCDLLLFVTTSAETKALLEVCSLLGLSCVAQRDSEIGEYYDLGTVGRRRVLAVRTRMGIIEHRGSSAQAVLFQAKTQARGMIAMGMAFGISPAHQAYGQVLGSESIFPYDKREVVDSESGPVSDYSKTKRRLASPTLLAMLKSEINREARAFSVSLGLLLSGGARISSGQFRDSLASQIPDGPHPVIGGDMEGVGLLSVSPSDDPRWVVVKGISDFAEGKSSTTDVSMRETACRNAVRLVLSAILHEGNS